ncbi:MAG TPA: nitronate monooxygenase [Terriglobales bacterium]|nr:nitronate monooxygenase [Terriglobales bacterium]
MRREGSVLDRLRVPVVQAPLAGGPSTPELATAAVRAGALGFLAGGYRGAEALREDICHVRGAVAGPFGVNLFVPGDGTVDAAEIESYAERVRREAAGVGAEAGQPAWSDDEWQSKLDVVLAERPAVVSFTFGCPERSLCDALHGAGVEAWVTVTEAGEAEQAAGAGADALVVQGVEAGGHRGSFLDRDGVGEVGMIALLRLVASRVDLPLVAAGGICDGYAAAAALVAGARAAQVGTALLDTPEAGTSPAYREALRLTGPTRLTRAFTGRRARGIVNGFMDRHDAAAPSAYPHVHSLTAPMRAAARARGDPDLINLWAGQGHALMPHGVSAEEVIARLAREIRAALDGARARM